MSALETCGIAEACEILHVSPSTLMRRARAGIVPGSKPGREWVFVREDLIQFVRDHYKKSPPCSIDVQSLRIGGHVSSSTDVKSASQLAQAIAQKRKSLKPKLEILHGGRQS